MSTTYQSIAMHLRCIARELDTVAESHGSLDPNLIAAVTSQASAVATLAQTAEASRPRDPLTPAQMRVMAFLRTFLKEHSQAPTRGEIAKGLGFASPNAAQEHLKALERRGVIEVTEGLARGIRLNKRSTPTC